MSRVNIRCGHYWTTTTLKLNFWYSKWENTNVLSRELFSKILVTHLFFSISTLKKWDWQNCKVSYLFQLFSLESSARYQLGKKNVKQFSQEVKWKWLKKHPCLQKFTSLFIFVLTFLEDKTTGAVSNETRDLILHNGSKNISIKKKLSQEMCHISKLRGLPLKSRALDKNAI